MARANPASRRAAFVLLEQVAADPRADDLRRDVDRGDLARAGRCVVVAGRSERREPDHPAVLLRDQRSPLARRILEDLATLRLALVHGEPVEVGVREQTTVGRATTRRRTSAVARASSIVAGRIRRVPTATVVPPT